MPRAPESLGDRIKRVRKLADLSCRELDWYAGITPGHSNQIERMQPEKVTAQVLSKIGAVFDVSLDWLYFGSGPELHAAAVKAAVARAEALNPIKNRAASSGR